MLISNCWLWMVEVTPPWIRQIAVHFRTDLFAREQVRSPLIFASARERLYARAQQNVPVVVHSQSVNRAIHWTGETEIGGRLVSVYGACRAAVLFLH